MNKRLVAWLALGLLSFFACGQVVAATSTFDADLDGWSYTNLNPSNDSPESISWSATGGNPDGFIKFTDIRGDHAAIAAPSKFLGDWSDVVSIEYDFKLIEVVQVNQYLPYQVFLFGDNGAEAVWTSSTTPSGTTDWHTVTVGLDDPNWAVTGGTMAELLANVTDFHIAIELVSDRHTDIEGIDNVRISSVPVPAAVWLFFSGIIGISLQARRKQ